MDKQSLLEKIKSSDHLSADERSYLINLINTKKYGLVWEDKPEDAEELLRTHLPVLREVEERRIMASPQPSPQEREKEIHSQSSKIATPPHPSPKERGQDHSGQTFLFENDAQNIDTASFSPPLEGLGEVAPNHILIEGDNLHVLTALTFTHEGKVDVMYFDPPYNTENKDFIYNDEYVDKEDAFRHSKWLSFMTKRIRIAHKLLKDDGVIFCSIGDDEVSQLILLFNEVFSENNKLGIIARVAKTAGDKGSYFAPSKDYVLAYAKNKTILNDFKDGVDESLFKKIETEGTKKGEKYRDDVAFYQSSLDTRPNQRYFIMCPDGTFVIPPGNSMPLERLDGAKAKPIEGDGVWRWANDTFLEKEKRKLLVFKQTKKSPLLDEHGNRAKWNIYTKSYLSDRSEKGASPRDYLDEFINRKGADLIKQYDIDFSYSKPYELIQHLIKITNKPKDILVLDFFAGSGTTLHAVLNLNSLDNGDRKCIIATNNENNICNEVTYPRCQRIILPYINSKGKKMPFYPNNNLRYYRTEFVGRERSLKNKRTLVHAATQMLCVKEDIYSELTEVVGEMIDKNNYRCFTDSDRYMLVIYNEEVIDELLPIIAKIESKQKIKIYVFAPGQYPYTEEFEDVLPKVELCALPDAIYKAYANVLPKK